MFEEGKVGEQIGPVWCLRLTIRTIAYRYDLSMTILRNDETCQPLKKESTQERGREQETRGKDQSTGKQTAKNRQATRRKGNTKYRNFHKSAWSISIKERGGKVDKSTSLKEPSLAITVHLKMEAACALCKAGPPPLDTEELTLNSIDRFCYPILNNIWSLSNNYALRTNMCSCNVFDLTLGIYGGLVIGHLIFIPAYGLTTSSQHFIVGWLFQLPFM